MNVPLLDLVAQHGPLRDEVVPAMLAVVERQQFIMGSEVPELEAAVARLSAVRHAIACASGTDALLLPFARSGSRRRRPGDRPAFTFFATAGAMHNAGGTPVFVDIEPATFNIPPRLEAAITPRTRAIIGVDLFGQMAPMESSARPPGARARDDRGRRAGDRRPAPGGRHLAGGR